MLRFFPGSWIQVFPLNADPYYVRGNHAGLLYVWPTQVPGLPQKVSKKKKKNTIAVDCFDLWEQVCK